MDKITGEKIIFEDKNGHVLITNFRIHFSKRKLFGRSIHRGLLKDLTSFRTDSIAENHWVRKALAAILLINGGAFLVNNYLFKSGLLQFFFGEIKIEKPWLLMIFYVSLVIALYYIARFFMSVQQFIVFRFGADQIVIPKWKLKGIEIESLFEQIDQERLEGGK